MPYYDDRTAEHSTDNSIDSPNERNIEKCRPWRAVIGLVLVALVAGAAWCMAGSRAWHWIAILSVVGAVLLGIAATKIGISNVRAKYGLAFFVLSVICWIGIGYFFPITELTVRHDNYLDDCPIRVSYAGEVLTPTEPEGSTYRFRGRADKDPLTVESLGPDGWKSRECWNYGVELELKEIPVTNLYIDNRGQGPAKLTCGSLPLDIAPNFAGRVRIPSAPKTAHLLANGKEIGTFADGMYVIDISGGHSYRLTDIVYVSALTQAMAQLDQFRQDQPGLDAKRSQPIIPEPNAPVFYSGQHVYRLQKQIDYFLTPHPMEVKTYYETSKVQIEFLDAD